MPSFATLPFFVAFGVSLVATPISIYLARRLNVLDPLDPRKVHRWPMPRWGGIGLMVGFLSGLIALYATTPAFQKLLQFNQPITVGKRTVFTLNLGEQLSGILFGAVLLFVMGLRDDRKPIPSGMKFTIQIIAAYIAMIYGVRIYGISVPGFESYAHFPLWMMQIITVLWLVGMTNAVNLIDGLDGLAAGVVAIVAGSFFALAFIQDNTMSQFFNNQIRLAGLIAAALFGASAAFLVYNFFPARVFMGDGGSLPLGFLLGSIAVIGAFKTTVLAVLIVPFCLVSIPVLDMTVAFSRRLINKKNPFSPDRGHLHHRLLDAGWTQREIVLLVYTITLLFSLASISWVAMRK